MSLFKNIRDLLLGQDRPASSDAPESDLPLEMPEDEHLQALCREALEHHKNGELRQAEHLYRQILEHDASHADTLHLLGLLAYQQGKLNEAISLMSDAVSNKPEAWHIRNNLGNALRDKGKPREAIAQYQQALKLKPDFPEAENNLGNALSTLEQYEEAIVHYRKAVELDPDYLAARNNLGNAYLNLKQYDEAIAQYQQALERDPAYAIAHNNLGNIYSALGQLDPAVHHYRTCLRLNPELAEIYLNLGILLHRAGKLDEAVHTYREGLAIKPGFPEIYFNLGNIAMQQEQRNQAVEHFQSALRIRPDFWEVHLQLARVFLEQGLCDMAHRHLAKVMEIRPQAVEAYLLQARVFWEQGRFGEALEALEALLQNKPDLVEAHLARGWLKLLQGQLPEGFAELEWRRQHPAYPPAPPQPAWDGSSDLQGRLVLVWSDAGLSDAVQCLRYLPGLAGQGARIVLEVPQVMASLATTVPGIEGVLIQGTPRPPSEFQVPLLSLPHLLHTDLETIPTPIPYFEIPQQPVAEPGRRIGLVWSNDDPDRTAQRRKSCPLPPLAGLADGPGTHLFSLQIGPAVADIERHQLQDRFAQIEGEIGDLAGIAAAISHMDLVITVDNVVAHLAGAMGKPVWLLLSHIPDWRWMLKRSDSPWYPSARLFRQPRAGDWEPVFRQVKQALQEWQPA